SPRPEAPGLSIGTFPEAMQQQIQQEYRRKYPESKRPSFNESAEKTYRTPSGYDMRLDHFRHFFDAIRTEGRVVEDAVFGARAAAPALLCNTSYREERVCGWDPVQIQERT
ncbi:MAG TPA: gfo/Idh/MocA family oxidoreductase, partial [Acidobacteriota bacterium]|nr:gfo/Idh/MocA family oxidoreductase [Acidobacteriota bacterium]